MPVLIEWAYIVAAILFILGLKLLGKQTSARRGNLLSAVGMLIAIVATLLVSGLHYQWIIIGSVIGSAIGAVAAQRVQMTAMPEMVALFNGAGGLASLLVGWVEYHNHPTEPVSRTLPIFLAVLIGGVTLTGSVLAYAKLAEKVQTRPILFPFQQPLNAGLLLLSLSLRRDFLRAPREQLSRLSFDRPAFARARSARGHSHRRCGYAGGDCVAQ